MPKCIGKLNTLIRIWTDAICVNQKNVIEVNSQLPLMRTIYSKAELNISSLGCNNAEVDLASTTFQVISRETQDNTDDEKLHIQWMERYPHLCKEDQNTH
jgi:hypothetical protein